MLRFEILGPLRAWRGDSEVDLGPPQQRALLALLLAEADQPITPHAVIDMIWGDAPPATATNLIHRYAGALRRIVEPGLPARANGKVLRRQAGGYRIVVAPGALDLATFRQLREQAQRIAATDPAAAIEAYVGALRLWRGPCAADLRTLDRVPVAFTAADQEYLAVAEEAAGLGLRAGLAHECLGEVRRAAAFDSLNESIQAALVRLLAASGRRAEALTTYRSVRRRLTDELGIDPGPELRDAPRQVLQDRAEPAEDPVPPDPVARPAQLPADLPAFVGRQAELAEISLLLAAVNGTGGAAIITVDGMPGVGKTALAVHAAHRFAGQFPDGQLYLNLRGFDLDGRALDPAGALAGLLQALGVSAPRLPAGLDERAALYRSVLTRRRVLVVLDNARDAAQVRPLLPGSATCLAIVTSRDRLTGLTVTHGARPFRLPLFDPGQAREYLRRRLGGGATADAPETLDRIAEQCGRLPLALAVVAARAATAGGVPLSAVADELHTARDSLDAFAGTDPATDARVVFSWSYRALDPDAARLFRLLALHPGPDVTVPTAASLLGTPARRTRELLSGLVQTHLVNERSPGHYTCHDLLRVYAGELSAEHDTAAERDQALHRLLDHYLHTAAAAVRLHSPHRPPIVLTGPRSGVSLPRLTSAEQASEWLDERYRVLLELIVRTGADQRFDTHVWQLTWAVSLFLHVRGLWDDLLAVNQTAMTAAARLGDPVARAHMHSGQGRAYANLHRPAEAAAHMERALELFSESTDSEARAEQHRTFSWVLEMQGRFDAALSHAEQSLWLLADTGHPARRALSLNAVGWYHALLGRHQLALSYCRQALALLLEVGEFPSQSDVWDSIGYVHHQLGEHPQAIDAYEQALRIARGTGIHYVEAVTHLRLGEVRHAAGDDAGAAADWHRALALLVELGNPGADEVRAKLRSVAYAAVDPG